RDRNDRFQRELAAAFGDEREDEFPNDDDRQPDDAGQQRRRGDRTIAVEGDDGEDDGDDQRDLQQRSADELEIVGVESRPSANASLARFFVCGETAKAHRPELLSEVARGVEYEIEETADRRDDDRGQM